MEENKEILNEETTVETDTESIQTEVEEIETSGVFSEVEEELGLNELDYSVDYEAPVAVKKKKLIQVPIIISMVILLVVVSSFFVYKSFFNTSIVGSWIVKDTATADEASAGADNAQVSYYTFKEDGTASITIGSMSMVGTYSLVENAEDGTLSLDAYIPSVMQGTFQFEISGNLFTGRTLVLTDTYYGQSYEFESAKLVIPELKPADDFKADEKLVGTWTYDDGMNKLSYEFRKDGTASINQMDMLYAEGVYSLKENQIILKYMAYEESEMIINYTYEENALIIDGYRFEKEGTATSDEA